MRVVTDATLDELNRSTPQEMLRWVVETYGERTAIITSFQKAGCVMIDMARCVAPELRIVTIDTLRLPKETYALIEAIEAQYNITIERFKPDSHRLNKMIARHGEFLFFDSKEKQEHCCQIRKVEPNRRALATVDAWITGLRRDQAPGRMHTSRAAHIQEANRTILKLSPLADWTEADVDQYLTENDVPQNELYKKGYLSIGCEICSTPILPHEEKRAGRWRWFNHLGDDHKKECGIHSSGSGI